MKILSKKFFLPALFAGLAVTQQAFAADAQEQEANQPIELGQFVTPGMVEYEVDGVVGNLSGSVVQDVDFYKFYGKKHDVVTLDIDGGWGGARSVDTRLTFFGEGPTFKRLATNDDARIDSGSIASYDSRIENIELEYDGVYYVAVSYYAVSFSTGGNYGGTTRQNGDYKLVISGVTGAPQVQHINIDIKPGKENVSPLNPKARGSIPVVLLSSDEFNPADVDVDSLTFGHDGDEDSLNKCNKGSADFNKDGIKDLICHFDNPTASFRKGDEEALLKGKLKGKDGKAIAGRGLLKVVPEKAN